MSKNSSPFKGFSIEEVAKAEANSYVIVLGNSFYDKKGMFVFSRQQAERHYNLIMSKILDAVHNGNEKDRKNALKCLANFNVLPLRLQ